MPVIVHPPRAAIQRELTMIGASSSRAETGGKTCKHSMGGPQQSAPDLLADLPTNSFTSKYSTPLPAVITVCGGKESPPVPVTATRSNSCRGSNGEREFAAPRIANWPTGRFSARDSMSLRLLVGFVRGGLGVRRRGPGDKPRVPRNRSSQHRRQNLRYDRAITCASAMITSSARLISVSLYGEELGGIQ